MPNPLESYRRAQRELRRQFEAFTQANCPTCPTPCCVQPARIELSDIRLAEATGWRGKAGVGCRVSGVGEQNTEGEKGRKGEGESPITQLPNYPITQLPDTQHPIPNTPCEYLGKQGCTFPADLRPFGCTTYICKYMYAKLDRATLTRIKRLTRELEAHHTALMKTRRKDEG